MSTTYLVSIDMQVTGNPDAKVGSLATKVSSLDSSLKGAREKIKDFASSASDAFTGLVERVGAATMKVGMLGAAAGFAAVTYGVVGLNQELENTNIALAAIFSAQGYAKDFNSGIGLASDTVAKMKQDVKSLPGDLGQLAGIFKSIATPGAQAGASVDQLRKMAGQTMIVGGVMGLDTGTSAREMAMLLAGRAGSHNILGSRMGFVGDAAKELNAMAAPDRLVKISAELAKYQPAIDAYGRSFVGLFTTLKDNVKYSFLTPATSPLFEGVKTTLTEINHWFDANQLQVATFAQALGSKLAYAWEWGSMKVKEWGPLVVNFVEVAYGRLVNLWDRVEPYVVRFGNVLKDALSDPNGTIDKLVSVLELYAAVKVGGGLLSAAGGVGGVVGMAKGAGSLAGAAGGGIGAWLEGMGAAGAVGLAGTLTAVAAAAGGLYLAFDQGSKLVSEVTKDMNADGLARVDAGRQVIDSMTTMDYTNREYQYLMQRMIETQDVYHANMLMGAAALKDFANMAAGAGHAAFQAEGDQFALDRLTASITAGVRGGDLGGEKKPLKHPGGASMNIAKVEITVSGNDSPDRVAQLVFDKLQNLRRHPRASPYSPNFSAANP
ncbi:MAG TPA: hypothetical protein VFT22_18880 [Kofleriaceae bacterium]|nr:hypothetical protein [Kofleriaceae bacterium]